MNQLYYITQDHHFEKYRKKILIFFLKKEKIINFVHRFGRRKNLPLHSKKNGKLKINKKNVIEIYA